MKIRLKKKNLIIAIIVILVILFEITNPLKLISKKQLSNLNYSKSSINYIIKYGLKGRIMKIGYNNFIDKNISSKDFIYSNYVFYKDIVCKDFCDIALTNELIKKGYNSKEITLILKTGDEESIKAFLGKNKYDNLSLYLDYDFALLKNIDKYIEYKELNICTYEQAIIYINLGLNEEPYENYTENNEFSITMLVNKFNKVGENFIPPDLEPFDSTYFVNKVKVSGNREMIQAFDKMAKALYEEKGLNIYVRGGYRSYQEQEKLYNEYLKLYGESYVIKNVSKPGFSEFQTGLAITLKAGTNNTFKGTLESEWVLENAYKYGFIQRYPKKYETTTLFKESMTQYRYVGVDVSTYLHDNKISFDEYYVRFIIK